jgi:hypothetical protein
MNNKINNKSACIFPDTIPRGEVLFPLLQVFEQVVYLRPVENDVPVAADLPTLCREMVDLDLVRFDCPAPLLDNRDRFVRLVHDLQHRRDDYAGQLSHLSLAGLSNSRKTETKTSIISTLLKQTGIQEEPDEQRIMLLWQARLLLKLGEMFDREQKDLQKNLEQISVREKGLLEELRKDNEQPFSQGKSITANSEKTEGQLRLRLKAWSRLFGLGSRPIASSIFITTNRDAFDLLSEHYESVHEEQPQKILNLLLPGGRKNDTFAEQRSAFRNAASDLIAAFHRLLENPESIHDEDRSSLNGADCNWATLLEQHYPVAENSRCILSLYSLPSVNPGRLFLETFGRDEDDVENRAKEGGQTGVILGIVEEQAEN